MRRSHHSYTDEEKQAILSHLQANHGDVMLTSAETGVPDRTLHRWRKQLNSPSPPPPKFPGELPHEFSLLSPPIAANNPETLAEMRQEFLEKMRLIFQSIEEAIPDASLAERVIAGTRIFDRLVKLSSVDPFAPHPSEIVSYEIIGAETFEPDDDNGGYDHDQEYQSETPPSADQPAPVEAARASITDFAG